MKCHNTMSAHTHEKKEEGGNKRKEKNKIRTVALSWKIFLLKTEGHEIMKISRIIQKKLWRKNRREKQTTNMKAKKMSN